MAAIAYQYDLDPSGAAPGHFQLVVVDEMFSNSDDQNAQYALKLFEQFGLQLYARRNLDKGRQCVQEEVSSRLGA